MVKFKEVEIKEDLLELIYKNPDVKISPDLEDKIKSFPFCALVMVEKEISGGIIINSVEEITNELIEKDCFNGKY